MRCHHFWSQENPSDNLDDDVARAILTYLTLPCLFALLACILSPTPSRHTFSCIPPSQGKSGLIFLQNYPRGKHALGVSHFHCIATTCRFHDICRRINGQSMWLIPDSSLSHAMTILHLYWQQATENFQETVLLRERHFPNLEWNWTRKSSKI